MTVKERYMTSLKSIADYAYRANIGPNGINEINEDYNKLKKLIEEHFTPQPFNANELRKAFDESKYGAIHVYDKKNQVIILITELSSNGELFVCSTLGKAGCSCVAFEDNRFYPIIVPNIGDKK